MMPSGKAYYRQEDSLAAGILMTMERRIYNFSGGPAMLPEEVLEEASRGIREIEGSGMSILEVSHRSGLYESIHFDAQDRLLRLLGLNREEFAVLFLGGGASTQFAMLPMNYLR